MTGAQERVVADILQDMARDVPMNRLLQGDVGSGKTAVAAAAMVATVAGRLPGCADGPHGNLGRAAFSRAEQNARSAGA